jgi:hypothetical protein
MIASPRHTLAELAEAIDLAFARWDRSHLHQFALADATRYMLGASEFQAEVLDSTGTMLDTLGLRPNAEFEYVFDLGDDWRHSCRIEGTDIDPVKEYGAQPKRPVPIWGWGMDPRSVRTHQRRRVTHACVVAGHLMRA